MTAPATHKIAIVAGQRFGPIPADTDNEVIREQLKTMGFADVASAEIKVGRDGEAETVEFVKKAGTKGLDGEALAAALARAPRSDGPVGVAVPKGLHPAEARLLQRLAAGLMTCEEALQPGLESILNAAMERAPSERYQQPNREGERLCERCDTLPAIAGRATSGW